MQPKLEKSVLQNLRAQSHALNPVVMIGDKGLTENVLAEIDSSLKAHELIKIKIAQEKTQRKEFTQKILEQMQAHLVQEIGKVIVIYRENIEE